MRYYIAIAAVLAVFLVSAILPSGRAFAGDNQDFSEWAVKQSAELDRRWNHVTAGTTAQGCSGRSVSAGSFPGRSVTGGFRGTTGKGSSGWNYIRPVTSNRSFLPITTRERSGPTRGTGMLRNPASARLAVPGERRLPINSMKFKRNFNIRRGGFRRSPNMGTRISTSSRRGRGSFGNTLGSSRSRRSGRR